MNLDLCGHDWAIDLLKRHQTKNGVRHAYLFTGPSGIGRKKLALYHAQALNCTDQSPQGAPCQTCQTCLRIGRMQHPDLEVIQSNQKGGILKVDQIRSLQRKLHLTPYEANYRIALFLRFEEATPNAANALLKTLEEPPDKVVLLLIAQDVEDLLPTIVSRCEVLRLRPLPFEDISQWLQLEWGLSPKQATFFAHLSGGRPEYAIQLHKSPEILEIRNVFIEELQQLLKANRLERFSYSNSLAKDKTVFRDTLQVWLSFWRDVLMLSAGSGATITNIDKLDDIKNLANVIDLNISLGMVETLEKTKYRLDHFTNSRLTAEVLLLSLPKI